MLLRVQFVMSLLENNMKIKISKDKYGNIQGWHTGSADVFVKIKNNQTNEEYPAIIEEYEIDDQEGVKLQTTDYDPMIENGKLVIVKNISCIAKEIKEAEKKNLKEKFKTGNFTNEDIKKLADLML
mgnify:CR=1 FL=1